MRPMGIGDKINGRIRLSSQKEAWAAVAALPRLSIQNIEPGILRAMPRCTGGPVSANEPKIS